MNLLIDRIENPGQRETAPLVPFGRGSSGAPLRRRTSGDERQQRQHRVSIDLPTISVNDRPILQDACGPRRRSLGRKDSVSRNEDKDQHHERASASHLHGRHSVSGGDVTSASAGMFSECMFKSESQRPVRHSPGSANGTSSPSSSSVRGENTGLVESSPDLPSLMHRHRHRGHDQSSILAQKHGCFYSNVGLHDNKRLVNQFLRSMGPTVAGAVPPSPQESPEGPMYDGRQEESRNFARYVSGTHGSLQSLLYHDLENVHMSASRNQAVHPQPYYQLSGSSSSDSSLSVVNADQHSATSSSRYDSEDSSSLANLASFDKWDVNGSGLTINSGISLNYNEVDFYRRHIGAELHKFEETLKHNLRETIMKNECDMQKNWKAFDLMIAQLHKLKDDTHNLHDLVNDKLDALRKKFDESNKDSFISSLTISVDTSANQLKELERRIDLCKKRLLQQRETLRKLEGLLSLEDSLLNSQKTSKLAYKYRYIAFDVCAFIGALIAVLIIKWLVWRS